MSRYEYAAAIQPVTCCEPGNWSMNKNGERTDDNRSDTFPRLFADLVAANERTEALQPCPLTVQLDRKTTAAAYYNAAADFAALYNTKYIAAVSPAATLRATSPLSGAVAYAGDEPFAVILPIRTQPATARAIKAYFSETSDTDETAEQLRREVEQLRAELTEARNENERITAALAEALRTNAAEHKNEQPETVEPKTAAELIAERFATLDGVSVTIKGAQTAAPVVWLTGDTDRHADEITAAGAKWSGKKSAYYVRVA